MRKKLSAICAALAVAVCIAGAAVGGVFASTYASDYEPAYSPFRSDNFEGLSAPAAGGETDYVYRNTALFFVNGNAATIASGEEALSGGASLKWSPGADWTESSKLLGISDSKITGIEGGYMIKLALKVRLKDTSNLVIKALNPSGDAMVQETSITGSYERERNGVQDTDPETSVSIIKLGEGASAYAEVEFCFRGPVSFTPYFKLVANCDNAEAAVILDDVVLSKESKPVLEYRNYERFVAENFDGKGIVTDSLFSGSSSNIDAEKTVVYSEEPVQGTDSLKLFAGSRNVVSYVRSRPFELAEGYYKLYYKFAFDRASLAGAYVKNSADDSIEYDLMVDITKGERKIIQASPLFDSSKISSSYAGVYTAYGEFKASAGEYYLELNFTVSHIAGSVTYDDVNLLKEFTPESRPAVMPEGPKAPSGRVSATYADLEAKNLLQSKNIAYSSAFGADISNGKAAAITVAIAAACLILGLLAFALVKSSGRGRKRLGSIVMSALMIATCSFAGACSEGTRNRPAEVASGYKAVYPERITGKLDNPGMGWVLLEEPTYGGHVDMGASGDFPEVDNISFSTSWAHIEVEEGVFDFTVMDKAVEYWTGKGKHINFRICTDTLMLPYTYKGVPDWLVEKYNVGYEIVDYLDNGPVKQHKVLDVRDKNYLEHLDLFLRALCDKYKDNPMIDNVEIRGFGVWGEWHTGHSFESKTDRMIALYNVVQRYATAFEGSGKTLVLSAAWDPTYIGNGEYEGAENPYKAYVEWSAFDNAWRTPGITFRRDSGGALMMHGYDEKLLYEAFRSGKRLPLLGEYSTNYANLSDPASRFDLIDGINDILYKMRANYSTMLNWVNVDVADIIENKNSEFIKRGNDMFGYRLAVDKARYPERVSAGDTAEILTSWSNSAVGIFPYKAPLTFSFIDKSGEVKASVSDTGFDARTFVQGEVNNVYTSLKVPSSLTAGKYKLAVSIETENFGKIALAMGGETGENTRIYSMGEIEVKSGVKQKDDNATRTDFSKINSYKFEPDTAYEVTFKYRPGMDMGSFYFDQNFGYEFFLKDGDDVCGFYKWQDISGETGQKTIHFTTGAKKNYKLRIESDSFGPISVGDIWIEKATAKSENFDGYSITDAKTLIEPIRLGYAEGIKEGDYAGIFPIYGKGSLMLTAANSFTGINALAKIDVNNFKLEKGRSYTVSFDFKAIEDVSPGGYYVLGLGDYKKTTRRDSEIKVIGEFYDREDGYVTRRAFSFVPEEDGQTLVFGIKHAGSYLIDNLTVSENWKGGVIAGEDVGYEKNVIPTFERGFGITETFESASFASSGFEWGQFAWGRMTFDKNEIVNYSESNNVSLLGRVEPDAYNPAIDNVWFEFARSKRKYYPFKGEKTYKVEFDYKILKTFTSGNVFVFFRDDTLGDNRFTEAVNDPVSGTGDLTTGRTVGTTYHYSAVFKMKAHDAYQFMICMHGLWEISVDNILITEAA